MVSRKNSMTFRECLNSSGLSGNVIDDICSISSTVSFEDGSLYSPIEGNIAFFFVKSGFIIQQDILSDGATISNFIYGRGSILFTSMVFDGINQRYSPKYRTFCNAELILVHVDSFNELMAVHSKLVGFSRDRYAEQLLIERENSALRSIVDKKTLVIGALLHISLFWEGEYVSISLKGLERLLGVSKQYIITVMSELEEKALLAKDKGGFTITDPKGVLALLPHNSIEVIRKIPKGVVHQIS